METNITTNLFENVNEGDNGTKITNRVIKTQAQDPFQDPGENLGRFEDFFEFVKSNRWAKSDENTFYTNVE